MTDFHAHVLPGMDDGSRSPGESLEMLMAMAAQGVSRVAATPHYYGGEESVEGFLARREAAMEELGRAMAGLPGLPEVALGAEAAFFAGMWRHKDIRLLCVEGTGCLLVEPPYGDWRPALAGEMRQLLAARGVTPVLAHVERYMGSRGNRAMIKEMAGFGALAQANAEFFLSRGSAREALSMLKKGQVHLLGSDCHGARTRPPNMGPLRDLLERKAGSRALEALGRAQERVWGERRGTDA